MKKLELRKFDRMSTEKVRYIYDNCILCLDYMDENSTSMLNEISGAILDFYMDYLRELDKDSLEYLYAKSCWAIDISQGNHYNTKEDFYNRLDEVHDISKEDVPNCINEALNCLNNEKELIQMHKVNKTINEFNRGNIQYLDLYPTEIEEVSRYLALENENGLKSMDLNENTIYKTFSIKFDNEIEASLRLCSVKNNFCIDYILYKDKDAIGILPSQTDFYHGKEFELGHSRLETHTVVVNNKLRKFEESLLNAISTYGPEHIDIINEDDSKVYIAYHSENDSFMVGDEVVDYSNEVSLDKIESLFESLLSLADKYDVGTCNFLFSKCL